MLPRTITDHQANELNKELIITADGPGPGGASHHYKIGPALLHPVEKFPAENSRLARAQCEIRFQQGPIQEAGVNGISNEALLAVVADRLRGFATGPYPSRETSLALTKVEEALHWLHHRTRDRQTRQVEGTTRP